MIALQDCRNPGFILGDCAIDPSIVISSTNLHLIRRAPVSHQPEVGLDIEIAADQLQIAALSIWWASWPGIVWASMHLRICGYTRSNRARV